MWGRLLPSLCFLVLPASAEELPKGRIIDEVQCTASPKQSYALYLPSAQRFTIDAKRIYTAGLSGGARVAMEVALGTDRIAGVIASSAGYPDSRPRKSVPFAIFGTAGTEDFNYLEMRQLDRALTSPHRVVIFEGGHTFLSSELAVEALEWMEVQAMKSGRRPKDAALIENLYAIRMVQANAQPNEYRTCLALEALAADFSGLRDVAEIKAQAAALRAQKKGKDAANKDRSEVDHEERQRSTLGQSQYETRYPARAAESFERLKVELRNLARDANASEDSATRRIARRLLRGFSAGARETGNPELRKLLDELGVSARPGA